MEMRRPKDFDTISASAGDMHACVGFADIEPETASPALSRIAWAASLMVSAALAKTESARSRNAAESIERMLGGVNLELLQDFNRILSESYSYSLQDSGKYRET